MMSVDPRVVAILSAVAGVGGWLLGRLLPSTKAVVDGEVRRRERDLQHALQQVEAAKKTPGLDDDERALALAAAKSQARDRAQRLKEALDAIRL